MEEVCAERGAKMDSSRGAAAERLFLLGHCLASRHRPGTGV